MAEANPERSEDPAPIAAGSDAESAHDRTALVALYHATGGTGWRRQDGWLTARPMGTWDGVTVENGRVTRLELKNNRLSGALPPDIGTLTHLRHLALPGNNLIGPIPKTIGDLSVLFHVDLRWNALEGDIPDELTRLSSIGSLLLSANRLSGPVPRAFSELPLLNRLDLSHNQLRGGIPPEIGSLRFLRSLGLSDNRLQGVIPSELGDLSRIERILLQSNELTGSIPDGLATLPELTHLNLADNRLSGPVPLARLAGLEWYRLAGNEFAGPLPEPMGRQTTGRADASDCKAGSDKDGAARPRNGGFLNGLDAWTATTSEVSDDPVHHLTRQGLSAITVVSGYATLDHSRIPDWLSFEDAEMVVKLLNDFLHSAGFIIEDAYDLLRVVGTYEGPTLDLTPLLHPNGSTDGHGLPQPLARPQTRTVGDDEPGLLQMPARLDQERHGDRLGDYRYRPNETVGLASCNGRLGSHIRRRRFDLRRGRCRLQP